MSRPDRDGYAPTPELTNRTAWLTIARSCCRKIPTRRRRRLRAELKRLTGVEVAVLVTDTFGRPWRDGLTEICLGIAGMNPMLDLRGTTDLGGRELHHTVIAIADETRVGGRPADGEGGGDSSRAGARLQI